MYSPAGGRVTIRASVRLRAKAPPWTPARTVTSSPTFSPAGSRPHVPGPARRSSTAWGGSKQLGEGPAVLQQVVGASFGVCRREVVDPRGVVDRVGDVLGADAPVRRVRGDPVTRPVHLPAASTSIVRV